MGKVSIINNKGAEIIVTSENVQGAHSGNLGSTNKLLWKSYEDEYLRLAQAAIQEARKKFANAPTQEKSLADLVNRR